jgi:hypothetical protein
LENNPKSLELKFPIPRPLGTYFNVEKGTLVNIKLLNLEKLNQKSRGRFLYCQK